MKNILNTLRKSIEVVGFLLSGAVNLSSRIYAMKDICIKYFLGQGFKNPYNDPDPVVYTARNGTNDRNGRLNYN